jgi:hypothetical protein
MVKVIAHHVKINKYHQSTKMENINQHIQKDEELLSDPMISPQSRRHTEEELEALKSYKINHPEDSHDPTPLELYCDTHPDALECRVYDD